ncbi:MAG TPA: hypothetical protein VNZ45_17390 [Bacteroidia bacterium]|nr:hypothetical protein [Bacteroidia bacterium]
MELEYVKIYYKAPIIHMAFKEGAELGIPEIRQLITYSEVLSKKNPYVTLSDVRVNMDVTHEGRRLTLNTKEAPFHRGSAIVVKNGLYQYAATLFSKFDKPAFPYRVFTNEHEARNWLLQIPLI